MIDGLDRKYRATYNANRFTANVVAQLLSGKDTGLEFPWDDSQEDDDEWTEEQLEMFKT